MNFLHVALGINRVLFIEPSNRLWVSRGYKILFSDNFGETFTKRARYQVSPWIDVLSNINLIGRALRTGILGFLPLQDGSLLAVVRGKLLRCSPNSNNFIPVLHRPGRTLKIEATPDGLVYAAEYFYNSAREPVHIFVSKDNGITWETAFTFPAGAIRHIHLLINDPYRKSLVILTGDQDKECMVLQTRDGFHSLDQITGGSQRSRAVGIAFTREGYYLATDTPYEQNYIQFLSEDGALQKRCPISGSCLSVCQVGEWSFFGTAIEPSKVNHDLDATIYATPTNVDWNIVQKWPVDFFSYPKQNRAAIFQMARIIFPAGTNKSGYLFATTVGVKKADGLLHRWKIL
jgi:hypothetical protein